MKGNRTCRIGFVVGVGFILPPAYARADYVFSIVDHQAGLPHSIVERGDSFSLDFVLSGDADDELDCFRMPVLFSQDGLLYDWYALAEPPFVTGGVFDFSAPPNRFEALTEESGTFGSGALLELGLSVPLDFVPTEVRIDAGLEPPCFDCPWVLAEPFILTVVPEPATLTLFGAGIATYLRRRGRRP